MIIRGSDTDSGVAVELRKTYLISRSAANFSSTATKREYVVVFVESEAPMQAAASRRCWLSSYGGSNNSIMKEMHFSKISFERSVSK